MDFEEIYRRKETAHRKEKGIEVKELSIGTYDKHSFKSGRITFKPYVAARIEPYKSLEDLKNNHNLVNGGVEPEEGYKEGDRNYGKEIDFIPEWTHNEDNLEDRLHALGCLFSSKQRLNGDIYFHIRWLKQGWVDVKNEPDKELEEMRIIQTNSDKHSYFHFSKKEKELKEIKDKELPNFGCLNGQEKQVARSKAISNGLSEWEIDGEIWNEEKYQEWYDR